MKLSEQFVITINRELGSGGRTIGEKLAEKLGVPFYDKALIQGLKEKYELTLITDDIFQSETEILKGIAADESCVIAGRSGFFVLREHPNHLSILIQARKEYRIKRLVEKRGITPKEAQKIIEEVDTGRENYVKKYTGTSRYDTRNYDLVFNVDNHNEDEIVDLILRYLKK